MKIIERADKSGFPKKQIFFWSIKVGRQVSKHRQKKESIPLFLRVKFEIARKLVFEKIRQVFSGRIRFIGSGAAPISKEILEFFHAADILSLEAYGATETSCGITINTPGQFRFGTVGKPVPGMELKIAKDGEILVRGPLVFSGYFKDKEKTAEVLSDDGWYATGDVGELDNDGFLKITDRKKDIIITSAGKNIAPQNIEKSLKDRVFISQGMVHGDKRNYLTCLIRLDPEMLNPWAEEEGIPTENWVALCAHQKVMDLIQNEMDQVNAGLSSYETIKYYRIIPDEFTVETGELTPTLKVRRKVVMEKYKQLLDSMYEN